MEVVMAGVECLKQFGERVDFRIAHFPELITERIEDVWTVDHDGLVGPEGGINPRLEIESGAGLMMGEGVGGIVSGPHGVHPKAVE